MQPIADATLIGASGGPTRWSSSAPDDPRVDPDWQTARFAAFPPALYFAKYAPSNETRRVVCGDRNAWNLYPRSRSALRCRKVRNYGRRGSVPVEWNPPCETWSCPSCAALKVLGHLSNAYSLMVHAVAIMVIIAPAHVVTGDVFRRAVSRADDLDGHGFRPWGMRVEHDDFAFMYTTADVRGVCAKYGQVFNAVDAFEHLRTVGLALPGIASAPRYCGLSRASQPSLSDFTMLAPGLTKAEGRDFEQARDDIARQRHQVSFAALLERSPPAADAVSRDALRSVRNRVNGRGP